MHTSLLSLSVSIAVATLTVDAHAQAQAWRLDNDVPIGTAAVFWDATGQRLMAVSEYPPVVWSFDSQRWRKHEPSGLEPQPLSTHLCYAGFDPISQRGLVVTGEAFVTFPTKTFLADGAGFAVKRSHSSPKLSYTQPAVDPLTGELMVFGGAPIAQVPDDAMHLWNGNAWREVNPATRPDARIQAGMVTDRARNRVVLFGGHGHSQTLGDTWEWDGASWQQLQPANAPLPRRTQLAFDPVTQRAVALGGVDSAGAPRGDCWEWDGVDWRLAYQLPEPGFAFGCDDGSSMLVVTGNASVWRRQSTSWQSLYDDATPDVAAVALRTQDPVFVYDAARGEAVLAATHPNGETWRWNGGWQAVGVPGPPPRSDAGFAPIGTDLVLFGGSDQISAGGTFDDTWLWNGTTWTMQSPPIAPSPRYGHAMASEGTTVLLFGGTGDGSTGLADTWRFNGATWLALGPAATPPARFRHAMAADPARARIVVFGGVDLGTPLQDTWEWTGTNWVGATPVNQPPAGGYPAAFDAGRGRVVVASAFDVWEWDGTDWLGSAASEGPQNYGALVYDPVRDTLVSRRSWDTRRLITNPASATVVPQSCGHAPDLRLLGLPVVGGQPDVHVEGMANKLAFVVYGLLPDQQPWAPGCDALVQPITSIIGFTDLLGMLDVPLQIPLDLSLRGVALMQQAAVLDGGPVFGASLSGRLRVRVGS